MSKVCRKCRRHTVLEQDGAQALPIKLEMERLNRLLSLLSCEHLRRKIESKPDKAFTAFCFQVSSSVPYQTPSPCI